VSTPVPDMFEERRTVSRKTRADGKLEISAGAAGRLPAAGRFPLTLDGEPGEASLVSFPCTCRAEPHEHYFIEGQLLRALAPTSEVVVRIPPDGRSVAVKRRGEPR
jgi:hypothetical protein